MIEEIELKFKFKIIFIGDAGVGKTSIINRKIKRSFDFVAVPTIGTSHLITEVNFENKIAELCLWDTAGQEEFHSLVPLFLRGSNVIVLVASLVDHLSIHNLEKWLNLAEKHDKLPPIIVVINKIDLFDNSMDSPNDIRNLLIDKFPIIIFVSARNGDGIDELFFTISKICLEKVPIKTEKLLTKEITLNNKCC